MNRTRELFRRSLLLAVLTADCSALSTANHHHNSNNRLPFQLRKNSRDHYYSDHHHHHHRMQVIVSMFDEETSRGHTGEMNVPGFGSGYRSGEFGNAGNNNNDYRMPPDFTTGGDFRSNRGLYTSYDERMASTTSAFDSDLVDRTGGIVDAEVVGASFDEEPDQDRLDDAAEQISNIITGELFSEDETMVESALKQLADICMHADAAAAANRKQIFRAGGHVSILGAMKKFTDSPRIQVQALRALANTCLNPEMRVAIGNLGGIDKVITTMNRFPDSEEVQRIGCGASELLIRNEQNAEIFVTNQGITTVIAAMTAFPDNVDLQFLACTTFEDLCKWKREDQLEEARAGPAAALALSKHYDNAKVRDKAFGLLRLLLWK